MSLRETNARLSVFRRPPIAKAFPCFVMPRFLHRWHESILPACNFAVVDGNTAREACLPGKQATRRGKSRHQTKRAVSDGKRAGMALCGIYVGREAAGRNRDVGGRTHVESSPALGRGA